MDSTLFIVMWDQLGLETIINVNDRHGEEVWAALKDEKVQSINSILQTLMLRARFNSQRHYEIYSITVDITITEGDLREMFENAPQQAADLLRSKGTKLYSDRAEPSQIKIS